MRKSYFSSSLIRGLEFYGNQKAVHLAVLN